jgi:uncharacterized protein with FMN-binding domain
MTVNEDVKKKGKSRGKCCLVTFVTILVILAVGGGIGWFIFSKEHREARSLPLNKVDFDKLDDGTYHGVYEGGMYKWRANECDVVVSGGKVTNIKLAVSADPGAENTNAEMLFERVIKAQSLQVDTITSATLTSKAYLQCVENALIPAQHE